MSLITASKSQEAKTIADKLGTAQFITKGDLTREIGSTLSSKQFDKRILALTDPKTYQDELKARMKDAEDKSSDIYQQMYTQYYEAGLSSDMAKSLALQSARGVYGSFINALNIEFPESTTGIYSIGAKAQSAGIAEPTPFSTMSASEVVRR